MATQPKLRAEFVASNGNPGVMNRNTLIAPDKIAMPGMATDAAVATSTAVLHAELEKREAVLREPLSDFTYADDININVSNTLDWSEVISFRSRDYGLSNGAGDGPVQAGISTEIPVIQANRFKEYFNTHLWEVAMRINYFDLARGAITETSIEDDLRQGIRYAYDMHLNQNTYVGLPEYGTAGLLNYPGVVATNVAGTGTGNSTEWANKTPLQIINDLNQALYETWASAGFDPTAMPNHIILPYSSMALISGDPSSELVQGTILNYFVRNNFIQARSGQAIKVTANQFAETAGVGNTRRMVIYNDNRRFIGMDILAPLSRIMFDSNTEKVSYDSLYASNISEVMMFYTATIRYFDGI